MDIEEIDGDESTTLEWEYEGESVSVTLPGLVSGEYSKPKDEIVTADREQTIRVLDGHGVELDVFEYTPPENCEFYALTPTIVTGLGVSMVMAHVPDYRGETLWQHEIDVERQVVGGPVAKWR